MVKVSVIVPVYNGEEYIEKCLNSLLEQTLEEIEIIVVDDGSTDMTPDITKRYSTEFPKIRYLRKENGGVSDARNFGLPYAEGEYIGYVDSDDYVDPDMYEVMYNKAKERCSDIVECNLHHTYTDHEDTEIMTRYYTTKELVCYSRHIVWNKIFRRTWLQETKVQFPPGIIYEDVSFVLKIVPYITGYDYVDIAPVHYIQRSASQNNTVNPVITMQVFDMLKGVMDFYRKNGFYEQYEQELEYLYARILLCGSFSRMCHIPDRASRKKALNANFRELITAFPNWRKNPILKKEKSRHALFMRNVNAFTYKVYSAVFPVIYRIKRRISPKMQ